MKFVRERIDHRNFCGRGHFFQNALLVDARDDPLHPPLQVARHIGDRLAFAEPRLCVVEEHHVAAHALDADLKRHARAQRWFFKNQREEFAAQRLGIARRISLDICRNRQQFARMRRAPFRSREQIVGFLRWNCQCGRRRHFHLETDIAECDREAADMDLAAGDASFVSEVSATGTTRGARDKTLSNKLKNSRTCFFVSKNGGSSRIVKSCVQLMSNPCLSASVTKAPPSTDSSTPSMQPSPLISLMRSHFACSRLRPTCNSSPRARTFASRSFSSMSWSASSATAQIIGPPPKVVPCKPGDTRDATASLVKIAPSGSPAASGFAITAMSGFAANFWYAKWRPVRPSPH